MHRASYWKTTATALAGMVLSLSALLWLSSATMPAAAAATGYLLTTTALAATLLVASGGLVCLLRDARETSGKRDLVVSHANWVPGRGTAPFAIRFLLGSKLRPGDFVQVKTREQIAATLDASGTLDGLPFMAEMHAYCGGIFRVHRRVDKINDMRSKTGLRRMHDAVTLSEVRCSGAGHDGCDAECQILWKDSWLRKVPAGEVSVPPRNLADSPGVRAAAAPPGRPREYVCQMTQLWEASRPMSPFDLRQDLRPVLLGNIGVQGWVVASLTRIFNRVQEFRGGVPYPFIPESQVKGRTPTADLGLQVGEVVIVRSKAEIARTLVSGRNRGLWFDRDMVRYCGQPAVVRKRVKRIIHEASKKMVEMKTPCVMLENVAATGEFLRLCPQHDYIFWREVWLKRPEGDRQQSLNGDSS
jgi:hypothetical protein